MTYFSLSQKGSSARKLVCILYKHKLYVLFYCLVFFKSKAQQASQMKNIKNTLLAAALQSCNEWRSLLRQSAPAPPDWLYIVIHCTPAAGSLSPSLTVVAAAIHGPLNHLNHINEHRPQVTLSVGQLLSLHTCSNPKR